MSNQFVKHIGLVNYPDMFDEMVLSGSVIFISWKEKIGGWAGCI